MNSSRERSFRFLQHLAADLSQGKIAFATFADATVKIRFALNDPRIDATSLARTISMEPLLPAKLLRVANAVSQRGPGAPAISDIKTAVMRVGYSTVRSLAVNVAMSQLAEMRELAPFASTAREVLHHSVDVAALSYVIAKRMTRVNPDEALFAGLIHDIGRFYLLSRIARYPELCDDPSEIAAIVSEWHAAAGHAVLQTLGVPEALTDAVNRHEDDVYGLPPQNVFDVLNIANRLSHCANPLNAHMSPPMPAPDMDSPELFLVLEEASAELESLAAALQM